MSAAEDQAGWVFHNLETGTVDGVGADSWLLDVDTLTADELRHLHDADSLGWFDTGADEIVRARGVAMSEVLDALAIVQRLDAAGLMCQVLDALAAEEGDDEDERLCADCYDGEPTDGWAEEAPGFRLCGDCSRDRAAGDDEWTDCNDDGGAVCNAAAGFPCSACAARNAAERERHSRGLSELVAAACPDCGAAAGDWCHRHGVTMGGALLMCPARYRLRDAARVVEA